MCIRDPNIPSRRWLGILRYGAALALVLGLSACSSIPLAPAAPQKLIVDGLDVNQMNNVFVRGFGEIRDRAFQAPGVEQLFTAALDGLQTIDPEIKTTTEGQDVFVDFNDRRLLQVKDAASKDIASWSLSTLQALLILRKNSPALRMADDEAIYKAMFTRTLTLLDPYSRYSSRADAIKNRLARDGVIGLGVRLELDNSGALVKAIVQKGPGELAGLKIDDIIVEANGTPLAQRPLAEVRKRLDGVAGTTVTLTVRRPGEPEILRFVAALDLVIPDTVTSTLSDGVLALHIRSFNQRTAHAVESEINTALQSLGTLKGVVLDLRGDPGGLLDQAIDVADLFLETGTIVTLHGRHPGANQYYAAKRGDISQGAPLAVIVDGKSASAAEIVAAALQDNGRAALVGTVSWGKGSVQTLRKLPNGGEIALTWARVIMPRGVELHGLGLMPDVCLSGNPTSVSDVVDTMFLGLRPANDVRRRWREATDDPAIHETLRTECPAELHPDRAVDLEVARRIVSDPSLFALALREDATQLAVKH